MSSCCHSEYRPRLFLSLLFSGAFLLIIFLFQKNISFSVSSSSSLFAFFAFGILAGLSTCSPITGSLFLSFLPQRKSALIFLIARFISFAIFGYFLGVIGSFFQLSLQNIAFTTLIISLITLLLSLNFLKIIYFKNLNLKSSQPILAGLITFFVPCGFTLTTQSLALATAHPLNSALIMSVFCFGTIFPLLIIFFTSKKITPNPKFSAYLNQTIGILLLIFSLYSLNSSLSLLNFPSFSFAKNNSQETFSNVLKMTASATGYSPNYFKVKSGQLIRWEVTNAGTSGCTNAIIAPSLFKGVFNLIPHIVSTKEFTAPTTVGIYRFSCWMGMISGTIEVIN